MSVRPLRESDARLARIFDALRARRVDDARAEAAALLEHARSAGEPGVAAWAELALARADHLDAAFDASIARALGLRDPPRGAADAWLGVEASLAAASGLVRIGDTRSALALLEDTLGAASALADKPLLATLHRELGLALADVGGPVSGVGALERAFRHALESGDRQVICDCANALGGAIRESARRTQGVAREEALSDAEAMFRTAHDEAAALGDVATLAMIESSLGAVILERGDWFEGRLWTARALEKSRAVGDRLAEGLALCRLAECDRELGAVDAALAALEQAHRIGESIRAKPLQRLACLQLSATYERLDRLADALSFYKQYHALDREIASELAERRAHRTGFAVERQRVVADAERARRQSQALASELERDALTGIGNRRAFDRALAERCSEVEAGGVPFTLALIDCDDFKAVNDRSSHLAGDRVLRRVACVLADALRRSDLAVRFGGDEFAVLFDAIPLEDARMVCERIRVAISVPTEDAATPSVTVSLGVARARLGEDAATLLARADAALYRAKDAGRNRIDVDPLDD